MLRVGAAGQEIDVIVRALGLARIDARWRVGAGGRAARRRLAGPRLAHEHAPAVVHDRILHRDLQLPALAGPVALIERADDAERQEHAGAGVADGRPGLDRRSVALAGDAHRAAASLGDRIEAKALFIGTAGAEAFDLSVDDPWVERTDDVIAEAQPFNRAGREIFGEDVGLQNHLLDQGQAAFGFEVDSDRPLVGVVHHEIIGVRHASAAGLAALGVFHLDDVGAHPGERLGAGRPRLELGQVENLDAGEAIRRYSASIHLCYSSRKTIFN